MSLARLVISAVTVEGRTKRAVARDYGITGFWVQTPVKRFHAEGEAAFQPQSRRPHSNPRAVSRGRGPDHPAPQPAVEERPGRRCGDHRGAPGKGRGATRASGLHHLAHPVPARVRGAAAAETLRSSWRRFSKMQRCLETPANGVPRHHNGAASGNRTPDLRITSCRRRVRGHTVLLMTSPLTHACVHA